MIRNIPFKKVTDLAIAIVPFGETDSPPPANELEFWDVFLINFKNEPIRNVIVTSKGYGELNNKTVDTTTFRFFYEEIAGNTLVKVEVIQTALFDLTNEYWVSFQYNDYLYDKRYIFVKGSISEQNFTQIPFIEKKGVLIR